MAHALPMDDDDGAMWNHRERFGKIENDEFARVTEDTRDSIVDQLAVTPGLTFDQVEVPIRQKASQCGGDRGRAMCLGIVQARRRVVSS
jgi:hypothetical protein